MELQHVNVKLLVKDPNGVDLAPLIPVFHSWIQDQVFEERLVDVADYRHVPAGPGVVLIGHEGDYSVDNTGTRLGVRYNRKAVLDGSNQDRLKQAARAALRACQRLETDPHLRGTLGFNGHEVEVFINDRLLAPNREDERIALRPEFERFGQDLFQTGEYTLSYENDPRKELTVFLRASRLFSVTNLLKNLS